MNCKNLKKMISLILFLVAVILFVSLFPVAIVYIVLDVITELLGKMAIVIDFAGNIILAKILNDWFIMKGGYQFGKIGETISSALGKNQRDNTLAYSGKILCSILDSIDKDHCFKSIQKD